MTKLIDGLLNLARADYQKEQIRMQDIRLDELLLDVREHILKAHPDYKISLVNMLQTVLLVFRFPIGKNGR